MSGAILSSSFRDYFNTDGSVIVESTINRTATAIQAYGAIVMVFCLQVERYMHVKDLVKK